MTSLSSTTGEAATPLVNRMLELETQLVALDTRANDLAAQLEHEQTVLARQLAKLPAQVR